jgi:DNA processing protein
VAERSPDHGESVNRDVESLGGTIVTPGSPSYPTSLRRIPDPPTLLFALGNLHLLDVPAVAIVGSRDHTRYGEDACRLLAGEAAAAGLCIVSGMARGLDAVAHEAALAVGGKTVGVLGNGLGVVYPAANRALYRRMAKHGCLLTEFPPGERPNAGSFPRRNRLISGLATATVVVEAKHGSGALITADCALAQGREVMAVPGPISNPTSSGTNHLIQLGAKPVLGSRDILEEFHIPNVPHVGLPADLDDVERSVAEALLEGPMHFDDLATRVPIETSRILVALTALEIRGLVEQGPGKVYARKSPLALAGLRPG